MLKNFRITELRARAASDEGFTLVEMIVASIIMLVVITSVTFFMINIAATQRSANLSRIADRVLGAQMEQIAGTKWDNLMLRPTSFSGDCALDGTRMSTQAVAPGPEKTTVDGLDISITRNVTWQNDSAQVTCASPGVNLSTNPSLETDTTGWTGVVSGWTNSTIAQSSVRAYSGTKSLAVTWPTGNVWSSGSIDVGGLTAGQVYTASIYGYAPTGTADWYVCGWLTGCGSVVTTKDAWTRGSFTFTAPGTDVVLGVSAPSANGGTMYVDAMLVEKSGKIGTYYDGSSVGAAWLGTPNLSASAIASRVNKISNPSFETNGNGWQNSAIGWSTTTGAVSSAQAYSGTSSFAVTYPATAGTPGGVLYNWTGLTIGNTYTFSIYGYAPTGSPDWRAGVYPTFQGNIVTTKNAWTRSTVTFVASATNLYVGIANASAYNTGQVIYVDAALGEDGSTAGVYFDGTSNDRASWVGATNASSSSLPSAVADRKQLKMVSVTVTWDDGTAQRTKTAVVYRSRWAENTLG